MSARPDRCSRIHAPEDDAFVCSARCEDLAASAELDRGDAGRVVIEGVEERKGVSGYLVDVDESVPAGRSDNFGTDVNAQHLCGCVNVTVC
jgi:hypothetical protein